MRRRRASETIRSRCCSPICSRIKYPCYGLLWPAEDHTWPQQVLAYGFTPLHLAIREGHHAMVRHILRRRVRVHFKIGPMTELLLPLEDLDFTSAGSRVSILELMARKDARQSTYEMLLDSFMLGIFFESYHTKWRAVRHYFWAYLFLLSILLLAITLLAAPSILGISGDAWYCIGLSVLVLISALLLLLKDVFESWALWLRIALSIKTMNFRALGYDTLSTWGGFCRVQLALNQRSFFRSAVVLAALAEAIILLSSAEPDKARSQEASRCLLAFSSLAGWFLLLNELARTHPSIGTFVCMINHMLVRDIFHYVVVAVPVFIGFTTSMHVLYSNPLAVDGALQWNDENGELRWTSWWTCLESLFSLSVIGNEPIFAAGSAHASSLLRSDVPQSAEYVAPRFFYVLYVGFLFFGVILLVNLLIAMMSRTYSISVERATLEFRVQFCSLVATTEILPMRAGVSPPHRAAKSLDYTFLIVDGGSHKSDPFYDDSSGFEGEQRALEPDDTSLPTHRPRHSMVSRRRNSGTFSSSSGAQISAHGLKEASASRLIRTRSSKKHFER